MVTRQLLFLRADTIITLDSIPGTARMRPGQVRMAWGCFTQPSCIQHGKIWPQSLCDFIRRDIPLPEHPITVYPKRYILMIRMEMALSCTGTNQKISGLLMSMVHLICTQSRFTWKA